MYLCNKQGFNCPLATPLGRCNYTGSECPIPDSASDESLNNTLWIFIKVHELIERVNKLEGKKSSEVKKTEGSINTELIKFATDVLTVVNTYIGDRDDKDKLREFIYSYPVQVGNHIETLFNVKNKLEMNKLKEELNYD